jgi:hypothetical protein
LSGLFDKKPVVHELCFSPSIALYSLKRQKFPHVIDTRPGPDYVLIEGRMGAGSILSAKPTGSMPSEERQVLSVGVSRHGA